MSSSRRKSKPAPQFRPRFFQPEPRVRDLETIAYELVRSLVRDGVSARLFPDDLREVARTLSGSDNEKAMADLRLRMALEADLFYPGLRERATTEKRALARELLEGVFAPFEGSLEGEVAAGAALPGTVTEIVLRTHDPKAVEIALHNAGILFWVRDPHRGETERLLLAADLPKAIQARTRLDGEESDAFELVLVRIVDRGSAKKRRA